MGAKLSKRRHRHAHHGPETTTTMEQDATIGGTGGAVTGLVSGVGFIFVNGLHEALGLRATLSVLGLCAVGGTVVGALVVVAGTLVVKSLAWLYRQLRKRARRRGLEIQLEVMQTTTTTAAASAGGMPTAVATAVASPLPTTGEPALVAQQAALAQARAERARAMEEMAQYDRLLAEAEAQLQQALAAAEGRGGDGKEEEVEEEETKEEEAVHQAEETAATTTIAVQAAAAPAVVPPAQFFQPTPLHITLRLRDLDAASSANGLGAEGEEDGSLFNDETGTDYSEEEITDDDEFCLVDRLEEGHQRLVRRALAVGGGGGGGRPPQVGTPPIY